MPEHWLRLCNAIAKYMPSLQDITIAAHMHAPFNEDRWCTSMDLLRIMPTPVNNITLLPERLSGCQLSDLAGSCKHLTRL